MPSAHRIRAGVVAPMAQLPMPASSRAMPARLQGLQGIGVVHARGRLLGVLLGIGGLPRVWVWCVMWGYCSRFWGKVGKNFWVG